MEQQVNPPGNDDQPPLSNRSTTSTCTVPYGYAKSSGACTGNADLSAANAAASPVGGVWNGARPRRPCSMSMSPPQRHPQDKHVLGLREGLQDAGAGVMARCTDQHPSNCSERGAAIVPL